MLKPEGRRDRRAVGPAQTSSRRQLRRKRVRPACWGRPPKPTCFRATSRARSCLRDAPRIPRRLLQSRFRAPLGKLRCSPAAIRLGAEQAQVGDQSNSGHRVGTSASQNNRKEGFSSDQAVKNRIMLDLVTSCGYPERRMLITSPPMSSSSRPSVSGISRNSRTVTSVVVAPMF